MLSTLATASAGPWPLRTPCAGEVASARWTDVATHRSRHVGAASARHSDRHAARLLLERPLPRRPRAHAGGAEPRGHAGHDRDDHLRPRLDEDDPPADRL